jgi:hypothetical protein
VAVRDSLRSAEAQRGDNGRASAALARLRSRGLLRVGFRMIELIE